MIHSTDTPPSLDHAGLSARTAPLVEVGVLSRDIVSLVDVLARGMDLDDGATEALLWAALALEAGRRGHSALPVGDVQEFLYPRDEAGLSDGDAPAPAALPWPASAEALANSPLCRLSPPLLEVHTRPGGEVVQTCRLAQEELWVAEALVALAAPVPPDRPGFFRPSPAMVEQGLRLFGDEPHPAHAVLRALVDRRLGIVTGGPGTGKTWSIKRVLAMLLLAAEDQGRELTIQLAAPTGKAGVRMREAMAEDLDQLQASGGIKVSDDILDRLRTLPAATLHRLLRVRPGSGLTRYGPGEPLPADVLVVDEASMIDLPMMRMLLRAIGPTTRLVLLGDRDQLPSVGVGSAFADVVAQPLRALCSAEAVDGGPLAPVLGRFLKNHRSKNAPSLAALVEALQDEADPQRAGALPLLSGQVHADNETLPDRIRPVTPVGYGGRLSPEQLGALASPWTRDRIRLRSGAQEAYHPGYLSLLMEHFQGGGTKRLQAVANSVDALLAAFDRYRILAVHRRGAMGVAGLTRAIEGRLRGALQEAWAGDSKDDRLPTASGHWLGQAVLVTRNAYDVDLWNGDVGLVLPNPLRNFTLAVAFPAGPDARTSHRFVPLDRLPEHSSAFVMTIHKSQGSQFDHVAVVLSPQPSPLQTRELVYTGITRAKQRVTWVGKTEAMADALGRRVSRGSLLQERILAAGAAATGGQVG